MFLFDSVLNQYLTEEIFPQISPPPYGQITFRHFPYNRHVYLICEHTNKIQIIGKIFKREEISEEEAWIKAEKEYFNLTCARQLLKMDYGNYQVVEPLGKNKNLFCLLVTQKAIGNSLDYYIINAVYKRKSQELFNKLSYLANFLAKFHHIEQDIMITPDHPRLYFERIIKNLEKAPTKISSKIKDIEKYASLWFNNNSIVNELGVMVHGDATPTNFIFYNKFVYGIDLEKMRVTDRCFDLGFIAAEIKHHFMWRIGNRFAAEPYIGHFLWEYAINSKGAYFFKHITKKLPLFMALGLLRIARNTWLDEQHRINLIGEAKRCLKYEP